MGDVPNLVQINLLRLTRSHVVKLQTQYFPHLLTQMIQGCYVRVLLEAGDGGEQRYRMAKISGTRSGEEYSGYSFGSDSTTTYLDLDVPQALGHSTNSIQLNSISNSDFSQEEYDTWLNNIPASEKHKKIPTPSQLEDKWNEIRPHLQKAGIDVSRMGQDVFKSVRSSATIIPRNDPKKRKLPDAQNNSGLDEVKELKLESRKDFPKELNNLTMDELHILEDQVQEYMNTLRQRKKDMSHCKICMEKDVEVVLLPCKHQIMCQSCSYQVEDCPVCRTAITDRITPHKF